jgi:Nucleotidyltransferase/DNA polymerase involved in DNA repair
MVRDCRSNETKALGIKMGVPAYQIKDTIDQYGIEVFSSNYTLYGDMSNRVMSMLGSYVEEMEVYSIDEAFLHMDCLGQVDLKAYGEQIVKSVTKGTGYLSAWGLRLPKPRQGGQQVCKKYPNYKGVCLIDSDEKRIKALQLRNWRCVGYRQAAC